MKRHLNFGQFLIIAFVIYTTFITGGFAPSTFVLTSNGYVALADFSVGDQIIGTDFEQSVVHIAKRTVSSLIQIQMPYQYINCAVYQKIYLQELL